MANGNGNGNGRAPAGAEFAGNHHRPCNLTTDAPPTPIAAPVFFS
jgi:hypothetical protein